MTPSASLLNAISGLTAPKPVGPKPVAPQAAAPQATATAPGPALDSTVGAARDGGALPETFDRAAPRGRYLDIVA